MTAANNDRDRAPRPAVSVVVPFAGSRSAGAAAIAALATIRLEPGDRLIMVDNNAPAIGLESPLAGLEIVHDAAERSSYFARNLGAGRSSAEWLLFIDADCEPVSDLLDRYFEPMPADGVGVLAGKVVAARDQDSFAARYARSRGQIEIDHHLETGPLPAGVTANLLVRRQCWEALGGFTEGVVSGADLEFCWRAQEAGWGFETRPSAVVGHRHPDTIAAMAKKARRHGAGRAWINRIRPGALPRPRVLRPIARGLGGALVHRLRGRPEQALFKLADFRWAAATLNGYLRDDNVAKRIDASTPSATAAEAAPATPPDPTR